MLKMQSYRPFIEINGCMLHPHWRLVRVLEVLQQAAPRDVAWSALCHELGLNTTRNPVKELQVYVSRLRSLLMPHGIRIYTRGEAYYMERVR